MAGPTLADAQAASARIGLLNVARNFIAAQTTAAQAEVLKWATFDLAAEQAAVQARLVGIQAEDQTTQNELAAAQAVVDQYNASNPVVPIVAGA